MLDQNTDRMWYVIGAVIVGAALIFLMNGAFPTLFASVGDTFEHKIADVSDTVTDIGNKTQTDGAVPVKRNIIRGGLEPRISNPAGNTGVWYELEPEVLPTLIGRNIVVSFEARNVDNTGGSVDVVLTDPNNRGIEDIGRLKSQPLNGEWTQYHGTIYYSKSVHARVIEDGGVGKFSVRSNSFTEGNDGQARKIEVRNVIVGVKK